MFGTVKQRGAVFLVVFASLAACQREPGSGVPSGGSNDDVVLIEAELGAVPTNAKCVRFTTVWGGGSHTFQQSFTVTTGDAGTTLNLTGLPYNQALTITAEAFNVACGTAVATAPVTYAADPLPAGPLAPGDKQVLTFVLKPTSNATGMVDFLYLTLSPTSTGYAPTVINQQSAPVTFTLMNIGAVSTTELATTISGTPAHFTVTSNNCPTTLTTRQMCQIQVAFTPKATGGLTGTLQVTALQGGTVTATLNGVGQNPAKLAISPTVMTFSAPQMLSTSSQMSFTISDSNNGNEQPTGPISLMQMGNPDFHVTNNCVNGIAPPQTCTVDVVYAPTVIGAASGSVTLTANPSGGPTMAMGSMNGTAISPLTVTSLNPMDFGSASVSAMATTTRVITFKNAGLATSNPLTFTNTNSIFQLPMPNPCAGAILAPNGTCSLTMTFKPNAVTTFMGNLTAMAQAGWTATSALTGAGTL